VVRAPGSRSVDRGFDSRPRHYRATTLGKLFTPMCLCSPSSIIWYLARAFVSTRHMWQPMASWHGSNEQGEYCSKRFSSELDRLELLYKLSTNFTLLLLVLVVQWLTVGLVMERSLVRLSAGALSSQLGQLSLPSIRGR